MSPNAGHSGVPRHDSVDDAAVRVWSGAVRHHVARSAAGAAWHRQGTNTTSTYGVLCPREHNAATAHDGWAGWAE